MTYRLTTAAKMAVLAQLIAALLVFGFTVWMLGATLNLDWSAPISSFQAAEISWENGLMLPFLICLTVLFSTFLLVWQFLGELLVRYAVTDQGLQITSLGIQVALPWANIRGLRPTRQLGLTERNELILKESLPWRLGLWLHNVRQSLPIYSGVSDRETLLATIRDHVGQPMP